MTGSRPIAERVRRSTGVRLEPVHEFASQIAAASTGLNPKARLLLLCARIGYTPHASFQR